MTLCLYKCLKAAGLEHHYSTFVMLGIDNTIHLSALQSKDYPLMGIHSADDKIRLHHLVQEIRTVDQMIPQDDAGSDVSALEQSNTRKLHQSGFDTPHCNIKDDEAPLKNFDSSTPRARRRLIFRDDRPKSQRCNPMPVSCANPHEIQCINNDATNRRGSDICVHSDVERRGLNVSVNKSYSSYGDQEVKFKQTEELPLLTPDTKYAANRDLCRDPNFLLAKGTPKTFRNETYEQKSVGESIRMKINEAFSNITTGHEPARAFESNHELPLSSHNNPEKQRISVCVRKRSLLPSESKEGEMDVISATGGRCVIVHERKEALDLTHYTRQHKFYFDHVFGEESSNKEVYHKTAYPLVQHMLSGGNSTCFAYGQTGAGKTHTMLGFSPHIPGLYTLAVQDIFTQLGAARELSSLLVHVNFFEIYCGQLYDLLDHRKRLFAREDGQKVVHISGLLDVRVDSVSSLLQVISKGAEQRTQGVSGVNPLSSRSHALLQIQLRDPDQRIAGRMWFVDLAGSERGSDAKKPDKQRRMEAAEINQSLLALKECIRSLSKKSPHTPFRQSKLTQVLKNSFVGDSMTCMIANISPGHSATEHTLNTLRYADRVKELRAREEETRKVPTTTASLHTPDSTPNKQSKAHSGDMLFHSTPKDNKYGEMFQSKLKGRDGFQHISPVRENLRECHISCECKTLDEKEKSRVGYERCERMHSDLVGEKHFWAESGSMRQTEKRLNNEKSCATFMKKESGFNGRERNEGYAFITKDREEKRTGSERPAEKSKDEKLQVRRSAKDSPNFDERKSETPLEHYQLPEDVRSSVSSSGRWFSPSPCSSLNSPTSLASAQTCGNLTDISDLDFVSVESSFDFSSDRKAFVGEHFAQTEKYVNPIDFKSWEEIRPSFEQYSPKNKDENVVFSSKNGLSRNKCRTIEERESEGRLAAMAKKNFERKTRSMAPTNVDIMSSHHKDLEIRQQFGGSCIPHYESWRYNERETGAHCREKDNKHYQFQATPLQVPTERPLSALGGHQTDSSLAQEHLNKVHAERNDIRLKDCDYMFQLRNNRKAESSKLCGEEKLCFDSTDYRTPTLQSRSSSAKKHRERNVPKLALEKIPEHLILHQESTGASVKPKRFPNEASSSLSLPPNSNDGTSLLNNQLTRTPLYLHGTSTYPRDRREENTKTIAEKEDSPVKFPEGRDREFWQLSSNLPKRKVFRSNFRDTVSNEDQTEERKRHDCRKASPQDKENQGTTQMRPPVLDDNVAASSSSPALPPTHVLPLGKLDHAKLCVSEAHLVQLREMEDLCRKEGELLCQQNYMTFEEFICNLEDIMQKKAKCIQNMRAQLQPYLN